MPVLSGLVSCDDDSVERRLKHRAELVFVDGPFLLRPLCKDTSPGNPAEKARTAAQPGARQDGHQGSASKNPRRAWLLTPEDAALSLNCAEELQSPSHAPEWVTGDQLMRQTDGLGYYLGAP
ncbi:hypothetical protein WJX84_000650, partial [Apatococcus fuscideae]